MKYIIPVYITTLSNTDYKINEQASHYFQICTRYVTYFTRFRIHISEDQRICSSKLSNTDNKINKHTSKDY